MEWITKYQDRVVTAEEAVKNIESNQRLFLTGNVSVPSNLLEALVDYAPNLENVRSCSPR